MLEKNKWCIYISRHPSGFYYKGKGKTKAVLSGKYKGSGTYFRAAWEFGGLHWDEWVSEVIETFDEQDRALDIPKGRDLGEVAAYKRELTWITDEDLVNPYCLNKNRHQYQAVTMKYLKKMRENKISEQARLKGIIAAATPEVCARRAKSVKAAYSDPEKRARHKEGCLAAGKKHSAQGKGRVWCNNGITSKMIKPGEALPEGFLPGRIKWAKTAKK